MRLIGRSRLEKALYLVLISGLIFAALHKWSTVVRAGLQAGLLVYIIWKKRGEVLKSLVRMPLLPATAYVVFVFLMTPFSVNWFESLQSWFRLFEMYLLGVAAYHLLDDSVKIRMALFYVLVGFGLIFVMDIQEYLRRLGERWEWGEIWDSPVNFNHHNTYSVICVALAPILVTFVLVLKRSWQRFVCGVILVLAAFLLYILQSRTAQLSLIFAAGVSGFFLSTVRRKLIYIGAVVVIAVVGVLNIGRLNPRWLEKSSWTGLGRTETWRNALELIGERPVFGWGYGRKNYGKVYGKKYGDLVYEGHRLKIPHAHSAYLDRLFANGIVGLLLFLCIPATAFRRLGKAIRGRNPDWVIARAVLISLAAMFFYYIGDIHDGAQWGLMWFLIAVSLRCGNRGKQVEGNGVEGAVQD